MKKLQLVHGNVGVTGGTLDAVTAVTAITNPVDVSGSSITIGNASDLIVPVATVDTVYLSDGTGVTLKYASGTINTMGDNSIVSAVAAKTIRPVFLAVSALLATNVTMKSDTGGGATQIFPVIYLVATGSREVTFPQHGFTKTGTNKALNLYLSAANAVDYALVYIEV